MGFNLSQALGAFGGVIVLGGAVLVLGEAPPTRKLDVIDVQRINVREPDGALRMAIFNAAEAPGIIIRGREWPHPDRKSAGVLFYNDEGTENGGLIFDGLRDKEGVKHSHEGLTFDRYEQDQVVQVQASQDGDQKLAGIQFNDRPDEPIDWAAAERAVKLSGEARTTEAAKAHLGVTPRAFVGRAESGQSELVLRDGAGRKRLVLSVSPDGDARIEFLDAAGKVTRSMEAPG